MTRSPYRIRLFLDALAVVWAANPDYRFGQLIMNLSRTEDGFADTWEWEDGEWLRRMTEYLDRTQPELKPPQKERPAE